MDHKEAEAMADANRNGEISANMIVHARGNGAMNGSPGVHLGTVERLEGLYIKISASDGGSHMIPLAWVERVDPAHNTVYLNREADSVRQDWSPVKAVER